MKQVLPFQIAKPEDKNLIVQEDYVPVFYNQLHQHEEIQISLILEGEGSLFAGDSITHFQTNDIFVLGSKLPHVFISEEKDQQLSKMISVFFKMDSLGSNFFQLAELKYISPLFAASLAGFKIENPSIELLEKLKNMPVYRPMESVIVFLQLLKELQEHTKSQLSSIIYDKKINKHEGERMREVFEYSMQNYTRDINLDEISRHAAMTKNAFCRYFKKHTNKTYITFLNELRIAHACKLLIQKKEMPIAEISEKSGFVNISNFNRIFRASKDCTPRNFRKQNSIV
ncbi:MAG: AraC family transcriptional regulator [Flavobacteriaceae bacterium]|nr:AraC family transcriptional regulator [Flavobacteriaceae bacterium]